ARAHARGADRIDVDQQPAAAGDVTVARRRLGILLSIIVRPRQEGAVDRVKRVVNAFDTTAVLLDRVGQLAEVVEVAGDRPEPTGLGDPQLNNVAGPEQSGNREVDMFARSFAHCLLSSSRPLICVVSSSFAVVALSVLFPT